MSPALQTLAVVSLLIGAASALIIAIELFAGQIAMLAGYLTSYPVDWWLLQAGIIEKM